MADGTYRLKERLSGLASREIGMDDALAHVPSVDTLAQLSSLIILSRLVTQGSVERLARGIYALANAAQSPFLEIEILARKGVDFVVTLESALLVHGFPNATPHAVWIAMKRGARRPKVDFPLEVVRVDERSLRHGIEERVLDGVPVRVV